MLLEEILFNFLDKNAPHILVDKSIGSASAAELTRYTRQIRWAMFAGRSIGLLLPRAWDCGKTSNLLSRLDEIRHVSVHRQPIVFEKLLFLLEAAVSAAALFWVRRSEDAYRDILHIKESTNFWRSQIDESRASSERDYLRKRYELEKGFSRSIAIVEKEKNDQMLEAEIQGMKCLWMEF